MCFYDFIAYFDALPALPNVRWKAAEMEMLTQSSLESWPHSKFNLGLCQPGVLTVHARCPCSLLSRRQPAKAGWAVDVAFGQTQNTRHDLPEKQEGEMLEN